MSGLQREEVTATAVIAAVSARSSIRDPAIEEPEIEGIIRRVHEAGL